MTNSDKRKLQEKYLTVSFTVWDTILFLDTHPDCLPALDYYKKQKTEMDRLKKEYEAEIGPLNPFDVTGSDHWAWVDTPMPWEMEV